MYIIIKSPEMIETINVIGTSGIWNKNASKLPASRMTATRLFIK